MDNNPKPLLRMTGATAKKLEALISIHQDLMYVKRVTKAAFDYFQFGEANDSFMPLTYWTSALAVYARAFKGSQGIRPNADECFGSIEGALAAHEYFIAQRNKLVIHSVNPFERVVVGVYLDNEGLPIASGELAGRFVSTTDEGFNNLNQLAKIAAENNLAKIDVQRTALLAEAQALTADELRRLRPARFTAPSPGDASESRA